LLAPIHDDVAVTSHLFNLTVSFQWRPLLDANFQKSINVWLQEPVSTMTANLSYPPNFIFIGNLYTQKSRTLIINILFDYF